MSRLHILTFAFFLLAILTYSVVEWQQSNNANIESVDSDIAPDFIAESLNSDTFDTNGKLSYIIDADRMEHYSKLDITHFEYPKYTLYPKEQASPWQITANEATLYGNNRVRLENRVKLVATNNDSLIQEIHGKYLELDLNTKILSSEQTVVIQGKGFTMYGSGLIVELNTKQMTLTEHVQSIYKKNNG